MARFEVLLASVILALVASVSQASYEPELTLDDASVESFIKLSSTPFKWDNCGSKDLPLKFNSLALSPDPVAVPGKAALTFDASVARDVVGPVKVKLQMKKKMVFWVNLPCVKGVFGSCTYNDICPLLQDVACTDDTCHCPFKKGSYNLPSTVISIDDSLVPFPWWTVRGQYKVGLEMSDSLGPVACANLEFTLA